MISVLSLSTLQVQAANTAVATASTQSQQELVDIFFAAARSGNHEVIQEFLAHGFPVDIKNSSGFTPLMMATYYGHQNIVTTLLENGANRCERDSKGHTALMGAIVKAEWSIAKQLRKVDCDIDAQQTGQLTAEEFAIVFGQEDKLKQLVAE